MCRFEAHPRSPIPRTVGGLLCAAVLSVAGACGGDERSRDLSTLVVVDSLYVDPGCGEPFSGPVHRPFPSEPDRIQIEGRLLEGTWDGEFRVFHGNGRIRYMGSFDAGARCGPWTENIDSIGSRSVYDALLDEIESLGVYPPCP